MTRTAGDSTNMQAIPTTVNVVCVYDDGSLGVVSQAELDARFPHDKYGQVWIDVNGTKPASQVRYWETGDKSGSLEAWVIAHNEASGKKDAVVYCNRDTIAEVRQLTGSQVLGVDYWLWVATLDGTLFGPAQYAGVIANQIKGASLTGGDWDMSLVFDGTFWLPVPATPAPAPKPAPAPAPSVTAVAANTAISVATESLATLKLFVGQHG